MRVSIEFRIFGNGVIGNGVMVAPKVREWEGRVLINKGGQGGMTPSLLVTTFLKRIGVRLLLLTY